MTGVATVVWGAKDRTTTGTGAVERADMMIATDMEATTATAVVREALTVITNRPEAVKVMEGIDEGSLGDRGKCWIARGSKGLWRA